MAEQMNVTIERTVTDSKGRQLGLRELDVIEQLNVYELAGENSTNAPWLGVALMVCSVRTFDGRPLPFPKNVNTLKGALGALGKEGIGALRADMIAQAEALDKESQAGAGSGTTPAGFEPAKN